MTEGLVCGTDVVRYGGTVSLDEDKGFVQEKVPLDAYWTASDEASCEATDQSSTFKLRVTTNDIVLTIPVPKDGISVGSSDTCDVKTRLSAPVPQNLRVVPKRHFARIALTPGFGLFDAWLHGHPVFDGDKMWRGDVIDLEGMRIELL